jgi:hypothetical protein
MSCEQPAFMAPVSPVEFVAAILFNFEPYPPVACLKILA